MTTVASDQVAGGAAESQQPPPEEHAGLRGRAITGSAWTVGSYFASQGIRLVATLVLQRLLAPEVFGIMAVVGVVQQGLMMFADIGIGPSIIQSHRGEDAEFLRTAWTIQVLRGVALWLVASALAIPVAMYTHTPELRVALPIASFGAVINGFNSTKFFTRNRRLALGRQTLLNIVSQVVSVGVIIGVALYSPTVWAPVAGGLVSAAIIAGAGHFLPGSHRDGFALNRDCLRELFGFGRWIFVSTVLTFVTVQGDKLIFAPLIPMSEMGVYNNASVFATTPAMAIMSLTSAILFPVFARRFRSGQALDSDFRRTRAPICLLAAVLVAGLVASGPSFVHLVFEKRFTGADWMVRLLSIAGLFQVLEGANGAALMAMGRSKDVAAYSGAKLVGMLLLIPLGYKLDGFEGAVAGLVGSELFKYVGSVVLVGRAGLKVIGMDMAIIAGVSASATLGILCGWWVHGSGGPLWLQFLVEGSVVTVIWAAAAWWMWTSSRRRAAGAGAA